MELIQSIRCASYMSPLSLVPRGPLGPLRFPSRYVGANTSKDGGTEVVKRSYWELVFATLRASVHTPYMMR